MPSRVLARLAATGIIAGVAGWLATISLQQDLAAYYTAGAAAARGLDPYVNYLPMASGPWDGISVYRHSRFLYPPLVAHLFRPLAALPYPIAKVLFTAASVAAMAGALALVARGMGMGMRMRERAGQRLDLDEWGTWWLPALCVAWVPTYLVLERGQIDALLLLPLAAAWRWRHRSILAGALLAGAAMVKPIVLCVLPLLVVGRRPRFALATVGAFGVLAFANVAVGGRELSVAYVRDVLPRAARTGEGGPEALLLPAAELVRVGDDFADGMARMNGRGRRYQQEVGSFARNASLPRLWAGDGVPSAGVALLVALVLGGVLGVRAWRSPDAPSWYWGALLVGVVAAPVSWAMGLVWALPLFCVATAGPWSSGRATRVWLGLAFAATAAGPVLRGAWVLAGLAAIAAAAAAALATGPQSQAVVAPEPGVVG